MRIAILIIGFLRTINHNFPKLKSLLSKYECDYYLHISNNENEDKYLNNKLNIESVLNLIKPIKSIIEDEQSFNNIKYINQKRMWYKIYILNQFKKIYENTFKFKYDVVLRVRPDLYIIDNFIDFQQFELNDNIIYGHSCDSNYLDEFNFGNSIAMDKYSSLFINFNKYNDLKIVRPTCFLKHHINNLNLLYKNCNIKYKLLLSLCNIIGISGDSGSGKTDLMKNLEFIFNKDLLKLECDRYHKWERGNKNWNTFTHLDPSANYLSKMHDDVFNLKIGNDIYQVDYDHYNGKFTEKKKLENKQNIILCGLHTLFNKNTNNLLNFKIYLDTDENLRKFWKIKRDTIHRNYSIDKILNQINSRIDDFNKYIKPQKLNSDLIIRFFTDDNFNFLNINQEPNIYLKLSIKKDYDILNFIKILNKNNIEYVYSNQENYVSIVFKKINKNFKNILTNIIVKYCKEYNYKFTNTTYYTIIQAILLYILNI